ncbi:hypothetical protein HYH03_018608 [Edaphochlamys debaryana]|uniref:Uncharacterized protein n=1 Tax=Edaphochlamys debaryana TaxID=47281 RepID=A0A835XDG8_9CHLO|nr:hypothetical protein HYH03_018608 [Edaphochlamys debaryana]|eukprot:KAG2482462.1 hypothetical protein HYH03_018608 [Edaphochlamys debaryana]
MLSYVRAQRALAPVAVLMLIVLVGAGAMNSNNGVPPTAGQHAYVSFEQYQAGVRAETLRAQAEWAARLDEFQQRFQAMEAENARLRQEAAAAQAQAAQANHRRARESPAPEPAGAGQDERLRRMEEMMSELMRNMAVELLVAGLADVKGVVARVIDGAGAQAVTAALETLLYDADWAAKVCKGRMNSILQFPKYGRTGVSSMWDRYFAAAQSPLGDEVTAKFETELAEATMKATVKVMAAKTVEKAKPPPPPKSTQTGGYGRGGGGRGYVGGRFSPQQQQQLGRGRGQPPPPAPAAAAGGGA